MPEKKGLFSERRYILKNLKKYSKITRASAIVIILLSLLSVPVAFINPYFFQILIDRVIMKGNTDDLIFVIAGLALIYIYRLVLDAIGLYSMNRARNDFTYNARTDIWNKMYRMSFGEYEKYKAGDLKMRLIDDVAYVATFIKDQIADYIFNIILVIGSFIIMIFINYKMTLISLVMIPVVMFINNRIAKISKEVNEKTRKVNEEYYKFEHDSLQAWKEIKYHSLEENFINEYKGYRKVLAKLGYKWIRCWLYQEIFNDFKDNYMNKVAVYIVGAFFVINGQITLGMLFAFTRYIEMFINSVNVIYDRNAKLKSGEPFYRRIFQTLNFEEEKKGGICAANAGNYEFKDVTFAYGDLRENNEPVLDNFNIKIEKGSHTALIGKSGCGKTTLIKLLLGMYKPCSGEILIGGNNIEDIDREAFYRNTGVVMQDPYLFNMTIKENIMLGLEGLEEEYKIDDNKLSEVCKAVNILDFIERQPSGFDTVIGEKGVKLSGGQRQKIAIARALLRESELIIFDEATSNIDSVSEGLIDGAIEHFSPETTVIIVSHRPTAVQRVDTVVDMAK